MLQLLLLLPPPLLLLLLLLLLLILRAHKSAPPVRCKAASENALRPWSCLKRGRGRFTATIPPCWT